MTNLDTLREAGVISAEGMDEMTADDQRAVESLTAGEISAMISGGQKLGQDFFKRQYPHGIYF